MCKQSTTYFRFDFIIFLNKYYSERAFSRANFAIFNRAQYARNDNNNNNNNAIEFRNNADFKTEHAYT